jgi:hypothetical protein
MIHASKIEIKPKHIQNGIKFSQVVQHQILDKLCKELKEYSHAYKIWTLVTEMKINEVTEQILNLYGYRIHLVESQGNLHLYDIYWN